MRLMPLWLGDPGNQTQLPTPLSGLDPTAEIPTTTRRTIGGGQVVSRAPAGRRTYKPTWSWVETDPYSILEEYFRGARGRGPHALLDSGRRNHLTANQSSATTIDANPAGFSVDRLGGENVTSTPDAYLRGPRSLRWTLPATVATGVLELDPPGGLIGVPAPAGQPWTFSGVASLAGVVSAMVVTPALSWRRVDGSEVAATLGTPVLAAPGGWLAFSVTLSSPPAGAVAVRAQLRVPTGVLGLQLATDAFSRVVANDWGNADYGGPWTAIGGPAGDYLVSGGVGVHSNASVSVRHLSTVGSGIADSDQYATASIPVVATGASIEAACRARYVDANNSYTVGLQFNTTGSVTAIIVKRVGGVQTTIASGVVPGLTYAPGTPVTWRAQVLDSNLRVKAWVGNAEPAAWTLTAADTALTAPGQMGLTSVLNAGNTNVLPVAVSFDNYAASVPPTAINFATTVAPPVLAPARPTTTVGGPGVPLTVAAQRRTRPGSALLARAPLTTTDVLIDRLQLDMSATVRPWVLGTGVPRVSVTALTESYPALPGRACAATFVEVG